MEMTKFRRVCVTGSVYVLFLYFLITEESKLDRTFYFITDSIKSNLWKELPFCYVLNHNEFKFRNKIFTIIWRQYVGLFKWRFLKKADFYGLDYYWFIPYKGRLSYIEDAPEIFKISSLPNKSPDRCAKYWAQKNRITKTIISFFCGPYYMNYVASSKKIHKIYKTNPNDDASWLNKEKCIDIDIQKLWTESSDMKKQWILDHFSINNTDVNIINKRRIIIFTQQFCDDKYISEDEHYEIYKKIISKYPLNMILIKTHPRDTFKYEKYFESIPVFRKIVPSQLLFCLGAKIEIAATISSSAVRDLPATVKVDWYGNEISEKLVRILGHQSYKL